MDSAKPPHILRTEKVHSKWHWRHSYLCGTKESGLTLTERCTWSSTPPRRPSRRHVSRPPRDPLRTQRVAHSLARQGPQTKPVCLSSLSLRLWQHAVAERGKETLTDAPVGAALSSVVRQRALYRSLQICSPSNVQCSRRFFEIYPEIWHAGSMSFNPAVDGCFFSPGIFILVWGGGIWVLGGPNLRQKKEKKSSTAG